MKQSYIFKEGWLKNHSQSVIISDWLSKWKDLLSTVLEGSVLGSGHGIVFRILINKMDDKIDKIKSSCQA